MYKMHKSKLVFQKYVLKKKTVKTVIVLMLQMSNRGYKKLSLGCLQLAHGESGGDPQIYALPGPREALFTSEMFGLVSLQCFQDSLCWGVSECQLYFICDPGNSVTEKQCGRTTRALVSVAWKTEIRNAFPVVWNGQLQCILLRVAVRRMELGVS